MKKKTTDDRAVMEWPEMENQCRTDSERLQRAVCNYLAADKEYSDVIYNSEHTACDAERATWVAYQAANRVAHLVNELIRRNQIVVLDAPISAYEQEPPEPSASGT